MQGINKVYIRYLNDYINRSIGRKQSIIMFGPRQVGKTTLVKRCLSNIKNVIEYPLQDPAVRLEMETDPSRLIKQVDANKRFPYVYIDEGQKVPAIFDAIQYLIDNKKASFIITGSSARKLRRTGTNLLPGRVKRCRMDPLLWGELGLIKDSFIEDIAANNINKARSYSFEDTMVFGSLPGIVIAEERDRIEFLRSYSEIYLEEEIRAEALSRKVGAFSRFLELSAVESGTSPNFSKLSQETGVSQPAVKEYYNLLEDTLIVERIEPYLLNARKRILSSNRYYFFDIGVRNALARLPLSTELVNAQKGKLFEHAVILELIRRTRVFNRNHKIYYWRTSYGVEVDCIIDTGSELIPIEIKSSPHVYMSDLNGLNTFIKDYSKKVKAGYVITYGGKKEKLNNNIYSIPWSYI